MTLIPYFKERTVVNFRDNDITWRMIEGCNIMKVFVNGWFSHYTREIVMK